jgi:hypothetical protein
MVVFVLPSTILWAMTAPAMVLVLIKAGLAAFGSWLPLWLGGGLFGLVALWSAAFDQASDPRVRLRGWQWIGLATGIAASLSLVIPALMESPTFPLPSALQVIIALPAFAAIRVGVRQAGCAGEKRTG